MSRLLEELNSKSISLLPKKPPSIKKGAHTNIYTNTLFMLDSNFLWSDKDVRPKKITVTINQVFCRLKMY